MRMGFLGGRRTDDVEAGRDGQALKAELFQPIAPPLFGESAIQSTRELPSARPDQPLFERPVAVPPEQKLADDIAALRDRIAKALYDASKEYQMLCSLTHSGLTSCEVLTQELRQRLAGNVHYEVLRKLDEAYALTSLVRGGPLAR